MNDLNLNKLNTHRLAITASIFLHVCFFLALWFIVFPSKTQINSTSPSLIKAQKKQLSNNTNPAKKSLTLAYQALPSKAATRKSLPASERRLIEESQNHILKKIQRHWIIPKTLSSNLNCTLTVHLAPDGDILDINWINHCGDQNLDQATLKAIHKASPLPIPGSRSLFSYFRDLHLQISNSTTKRT
jgi:membrane protein involved in colicin uptake